VLFAEKPVYGPLERELEALRSHQECTEELERDKNTLLESYAGLAAEILAGLTPKERHQVYKMLRVRAVVNVDGTLEVSGALAGAIGVSNWETAPTYRAEFTTPSGLKRLTELRLRAWLTSSGTRHIELARG